MTEQEKKRINQVCNGCANYNSSILSLRSLLLRAELATSRAGLDGSCLYGYAEGCTGKHSSLSLCAWGEKCSPTVGVILLYEKYWHVGCLIHFPSEFVSHKGQRGSGAEVFEHGWLKYFQLLIARQLIWI